MKTPTHRRHGLHLLLAAMLTLPGAPAFAQASHPSSTTIAGLTVHGGPSDAVQAWQRAVEAGDGEAIARMNGPHTVAYGIDSAVAQGGAAIAAGYDAMFAKYLVKVEIRDAGWVRQGPLLNSWGRFALTLTPRAGGQPVRMDGRFSDLAAWTDGRWVYVMDHASVPMP